MREALINRAWVRTRTRVHPKWSVPEESGQCVQNYAWVAPRTRKVARTRPFARIGSAALFVCLLLAACTDDDSSKAQRTTTSSTTSSTIDGPSAEVDAVVAAYKAAELAGIRAGMIPDPDYPDLAATHTGPMLERARELYRGYQLRNVAYRYPDPPEKGFRITVDPETVEITGDVALFEACAVDEGQRIDTETGKPLSPDGGVSTVLLKVAMQRVDGVWKLAERKNLDSWDGVAGCAA